MTISTFILVVISFSLSMPSLGTMLSNPESTPPSPCVEDRDPYYDGIRVNCQHKGISSLPLPAHWIPLEASSLLLDHNAIAHLNKTSFSTFSTWTRLRLLGLSSNSISHIEPFTFSKFVSLRVLDLENNRINLNQNSLSGQVFEGLDNLSNLKLSGNMKGAQEGTYPTSLLNSLHNLQNLSLDTFKGDLNFCNLFHASTRLSNLVLTGGMTWIKNESLNCFSSFNLNKLSLRGCMDLQYIESMAFRHLKYLQSYELLSVGLWLRETLESLAPLVNRTMSHLIFSHLSYDKSRSKSFAEDSILTVHMARFLTQICVENFVLTDSGIFVIESNVFNSSTWMRCLKTLDFSHNPILGELGLVYPLSSMRRLEEITIMDVKYCFRSFVKGLIWQPPKCPCKLHNFAFDAVRTVEGTAVQRSKHNDNDESLSRSQINRTYDILSPNNSALSPRFVKRAINKEVRKNKLQSPFLHYIYFPKHLRILILNSFSDYFLRFDQHVHYVNGDNLEEFHLSNNGIRKFTGSYSGLPNLKLIDFSRNVGSLMSPTFFNGFSSVAHLNMAELNLDYIFMKEHSRELFMSLTNLSTLDLSRNDLRDLSKDTFNTNSELRVLLLAGNRFESVPFDLSHVPLLCWLDLSGNALRELSQSDRTTLDRHADKVPEFSLSLDGNPMHCGCQSLRFLSWLKRTHINLDKQGNYSCTLDSGIMTTTGEMQDLDVMWRKCNGEKSFLITLVLLCITISGFFCFIVTFKFKTQLKAFLLRIFWPPFVMKTPADYTIGVYIGYADQDRNLACFRIRQFIEEGLDLSTYIRHRDLLPASDMAGAIVEAVHSSWRVLFVVSNHFLTDPWSYFALKTATYAAQVENPGRIVLLMMDGDDNETLLCQLPSCILRAVQEQSIVTMTSRGQISYEDKQALTTALLYQGSFFDD